MSDDQDLGERDNEDPDEFPPADREIQTQGYDLSVNTLFEQWKDETLVVPDFQREYVWDNPKASRLIESLLLNIPIPVLYFAENEHANYEIVDGHQRVFSVVRYLDNQFSLSGLRISQEFKGKRFHQLPEREQRFLKTRVMRAIIIGYKSSSSMKFEVFERLNTGGLALNAQEIRNALYHGRLNDLLKDLEKADDFRALISSKNPRKRMVDRELVLRFLALSDALDTYRTPLVRFLNDYMDENRNPSHEWVDERRNRFVRTSSLVRQVLGQRGFRPRTAETGVEEKAVNRALYDAQMYVFSYANTDSILANKDSVRRALTDLFDRSEFQNSIRRATGDRARLLHRCGAIASSLRFAGVSLDPRLDEQMQSLEALIRK